MGVSQLGGFDKSDDEEDDGPRFPSKSLSSVGIYL